MSDITRLLAAKDAKIAKLEEEIAAFCVRYTTELERWVNEKRGAGQTYDGTISGLITLYRKEEISPYRQIKSNTRRMYDESLDMIEKAVGGVMLAELKGSDFRRWYDKFRAPKKEGAPERMRRAFKAVKLLRIVIGFGITEDIPECARLKGVLDEMRFSKPARRKSFVTFAQSQAIIAAAIEMGRPSIAIAQAARDRQV